METLPRGSSLVLVGAWDDLCVAARQRAMDLGHCVMQKVSKNVNAVVCVPSEATLDRSAQRRVAGLRMRGLQVLDFQPDPAPAEQRVAGGALPAAPKRKATDEIAAAAGPDSKKMKKAAEPAAEKRLAPWRSVCSQASSLRIERALAQRMFLIDQADEVPGSNVPSRLFKVLGSTGNLYTVRIASRVSCDCPDAVKGNLCKHVCFVFLRVLHLPQTSPFVYQTALLQSELRDIFARSARPTADVLASTAVRQAYDVATGKASAPAVAEPTLRGDASDDCSVCFEPLKSDSFEVCATCRNGVHTGCLRRWAQAKAERIANCPYCRAAWPTTASTAAPNQQRNEGYLNFAPQAGLSQERTGYSGYGHRWQRYYRSHYGDDGDDADDDDEIGYY